MNKSSSSSSDVINPRGIRRGRDASALDETDEDSSSSQSCTKKYCSRFGIDSKVRRKTAMDSFLQLNLGGKFRTMPPTRCLLIFTDETVGDMVFAHRLNCWFGKMDLQANGTVLLSRAHLHRRTSLHASAACMDVQIYQVSIEGLNLWGEHGLSPEELKSLCYAAFGWPSSYKPWATVLWTGNAEFHERFDLLEMDVVTPASVETVISCLLCLGSLILW